MSSSNIKSWADASSDSDSEDERIAPPPSNLPGSAITDEDDAEFDDGGFFPGKTLDDMPKEAPFTAFVGNLNRGMEGKEFHVEVERLLVDRGVSLFVFVFCFWVIGCVTAGVALVPLMLTV